MKEITRRSAVKSIAGSAAAVAAMTSAFAGSFSALTMLGGCTPNSKQENANKNSSEAALAGPVSGNTEEVIVSMTKESEPASGFNPIFTWGCGEHVHEPLIQSTLITTNASMEFVGDLATNWESSADGLSWTFTIRTDAKFTDGISLVANDVAFTLNTIKENPASQCDLSMMKRAEAVNETTVQIHLNYPYNALLFDLAVIGIVPEHAYNVQTYGENPVGSGRYMLEEWRRGEQVILVANPSYYGDQPTIKRLVVVFMDEDASLAAALAQKVDVAYTAPTLADNTHPSGYDILNCESVDSRGISLPCIPPSGLRIVDGDMPLDAGNFVTSDINVRRAINYGIDRKRMVDTILNGYGTPAYSVADAMPWYNPAMEVAFDRQAAHAAMEAGGWVLDEEGIYMKNMDSAAEIMVAFDDKDATFTRAEFDLFYSASDSVRQALANEFANQMREIGIKVVPRAGAWTYEKDGIYSHQYSDPVLWGWGSNSPTEFYNLTRGNSESNYSSYVNETVDSHMQQALAAQTVEESYPDWQAAQWDGREGIAPVGAASWAWLCNVNHLYFKRTGLEVAKQKPHPHGHGWSLVNNVDKWSWR